MYLKHNKLHSYLKIAAEEGGRRGQIRCAWRRS